MAVLPRLHEDVDAFDPTVAQPLVARQPRGPLLIAGLLVAFVWLPAFAAAAVVALH